MAAEPKKRTNLVDYFHTSPDSNIQRLHGNWHHKFQDKGLFVSPTYRAVVLDWFGTIAMKRRGAIYRQLTVYRLTVPQAVVDDCLALYERTPHGFLYRGAVHHGFRDWGDELFIPEAYLPQVRIVGRRTQLTSELQAQYRRRNARQRESYEISQDLSRAATKVAAGNRAARVYLQLRDEVHNLRLRGASLPEYLSAWLEGFRKYLFETGSNWQLKHRVTKEELRDAEHRADKIRSLFFPRMRAEVAPGRPTAATSFS